MRSGRSPPPVGDRDGMPTSGCRRARDRHLAHPGVPAAAQAFAIGRVDHRGRQGPGRARAMLRRCAAPVRRDHMVLPPTPGRNPAHCGIFTTAIRPFAPGPSSDCRCCKTSPRPGRTAGVVGRSTTRRAARLTNPRCASRMPTDSRSAAASCSSAGATPGPATLKGGKPMKPTCGRPKVLPLVCSSSRGEIESEGRD